MALGRGGDALVHHAGESLFVPGLLPGERGVLRRRGGGAARLERLLSRSPLRAAPVCRQFGQCGGCTLQHLAPAASADFKRQRVERALHQAGFALPAASRFVPLPAGSRRRMDLAVRRTHDGVQVGLHGRGSRALAALDGCAVLAPRLLALALALPSLLSPLACLRRQGSAIANLLDNGADLLLATDAAPTAACRGRLARFAAEHGLPRISWRPLAPQQPSPPQAAAETLCRLAAPVLHLSGVPVEPPPGAFLQASRPGEQAIIACVLDALPDRLPRRQRIVELYAGCGTLSLAIAARGARLLAVEGDAAAAACLRRAAVGRPLEVLGRDLGRQPLSSAELAQAACLVLDPPWDGAGPQMPPLARSGVGRIVMVSCNPDALARDARLLHQAGYGLAGLTIIDQFNWSAEIEAVAVFERGGPRRTGPRRDPQA